MGEWMGEVVDPTRSFVKSPVGKQDDITLLPSFLSSVFFGGCGVLFGLAQLSLIS